MHSYTVHYTLTDTGESKTMVTRAEDADSAVAGARQVIRQSYPGRPLVITRASEVNDHRKPAPNVPLAYAPCGTDGDGRCAQHGGYMRHVDRCQTWEVLADVRAERSRQFAQYGTNEDIEDGTGPYVEWLQGVDAWGNGRVLEKELRANYEEYEAQHGAPTWRHLVLEEVAEVFAESDLKRLREELVQVAALAVSWIEKIDGRNEVR